MEEVKVTEELAEEVVNETEEDVKVVVEMEETAPDVLKTANQITKEFCEKSGLKCNNIMFSKHNEERGEIVGFNLLFPELYTEEGDEDDESVKADFINNNLIEILIGALTALLEA